MVRHGIDLDSESVRAFCRKWKIRELSVFGSILRDDFGPESDVDFLADFGDDPEWDLCDHVDMEEELAQIVGRPVDLLTRFSVETDQNWLFRTEVMATAERVHAG